MCEESEQVEVSASKLHLLLASQQETKKKCVEQIAKLQAEIKAKDEKIGLYDNALKKMQMMKHTKSTVSGENTRKVIEEMQKSKQFDEWLEKNREKMVDAEYKKNYEAEVELLRKKLNEL